MSGNLCRCGAYVNIVAAIRESAAMSVPASTQASTQTSTQGQASPA